VLNVGLQLCRLVELGISSTPGCGTCFDQLTAMVVAPFAVVSGR